MKVFSAFDGMSCGRYALEERLGFPITRYVASEIDKYAIRIALTNFIDTEQVGDITKVNGYDYPDFDLLIGGSPCQGFSFAGKQLNFEDPRSKLFFEFVRLKNEMKPKFFFLENVRMKKEHQDVISKYLGVEPVALNSSLISAQSRYRLYWTNIPGYTEPEDKGILLKDIVHENTNLQKFRISDTALSNTNYVTDYTIKGLQSKNSKGNCLCATTHKGFGNDGTTVVLESLAEYIVPFDKTLQILEKEVERGKVGYFRKDSQANRVYYIHDKAVTLCGDAGGGAAKMGQYLFGCTTPDYINKNQNGQRSNDGTKFYTLTASGVHGILIEGYIRKLTPIECERLQTLPDGYTRGVSNSQRYKMLGNGWTVDAVCEFFKHIPVKHLDLF